ncbi:MAG: Holliday junction resolvase Hjc [Candidatus Bathyarchaeia archaeon]
MARGSDQERELVHRLDELGFAVLRAPASGAKTRLDRPDIVAGRKGFHISIEVKTTSRKTLYINRESIEQLLRFAERFDAKPLLAVKFKRQHRDWLLLEPRQLVRTSTGYKLPMKTAINRGATLEALVSRRITDFE